MSFCSRAFQNAALSSHKETDGRLRDLLQQVEEIRVLQEQDHRSRQISDPESSQSDSGQPQHLAERISHERTERSAEEGARTDIKKKIALKTDIGEVRDPDDATSLESPRKRFRQGRPDMSESQGLGSSPNGSQRQRQDYPASATERVMPEPRLESEAPRRSRQVMQTLSSGVRIEAQSSMSDWLSSFEH